MTKPHKHAEFLHALADGRGDEFEAHHESWGADAWRIISSDAWRICMSPDDWTVRRKPKTKTIRIGDMDVLEPMRVAPAMGTVVWLVCIHTDSPFRYSWSGNATERKWLKLGVCQATEQGAMDQRRAMILLAGGTP